MFPNIQIEANKFVMPSTGEEVEYYPISGAMEKQLGLVAAAKDAETRDLSDQYGDEINKESDLYDEEQAAAAAEEITGLIMNFNKDLLDTINPVFPKFDIKNASMGDLDLIYTHLRRRSMHNKLELTAQCPKCGHYNPITVDLNLIKARDAVLSTEIELYDGSRLVIGHTSAYAFFEESLSSDDIERDLLVHSFRTLKHIQDDGTFIEYDLADATVAERIEWAFTEHPLPDDQGTFCNIQKDELDQIRHFLEHEAPGMDPIINRVERCEGMSYDGMPITPTQASGLAKDDPANINKISKCGHGYDHMIETVQGWFNFFD